MGEDEEEKKGKRRKKEKEDEDEEDEEKEENKKKDKKDKKDEDEDEEEEKKKKKKKDEKEKKEKKEKEGKKSKKVKEKSKWRVTDKTKVENDEKHYLKITLKLDLGGDVWIVALYDHDVLELVKIKVTGLKTYTWLGTKFDDEPQKLCLKEKTFTTACFKGEDKGKDAYHVHLNAG